MDFFVSKEKNFFLFFTLTPSHLWLKRPVYRGFKCEGKCEGKFLPSHPLTRSIPAGKPCLSEIYVTFCAYCFNPLRTGNDIWLNYSDFILSFI